MKTRQSRRQAAKVSHSRWLAYATAGAATALAGGNSLEAAVHYSGTLLVRFPPREDKLQSFQLDQPGDSFQLQHSYNEQFHFAFARFHISAIASAAFRGESSSGYFYVSRLSFGQNISAGQFTDPGAKFGTMAYGSFIGLQQWTDRGAGFIGFRFNNGAGVQYGWARVKVTGIPKNGFRLIDYAYADPGEPITAGQKSSDERAPVQGSLGWLAAGAVGLLVWRKTRSRRDRRA